MVEWMPRFCRNLIKLRTNHWKTLQLVTAREVWQDCVSFLNQAFSFRLKSWEELLELGRMDLPLMVHIQFSGLNSELFTTILFLHLWMHFRFYQCAKYSVILMEVRAQLWYLQTSHVSSAHCYFASLNFDELIPECHCLLPELRIRNTKHSLKNTGDPGASPQSPTVLWDCWLSLIHSATVGSGHQSFRGNRLCWQLLLKAFSINLPSHPSSATSNTPSKTHTRTHTQLKQQHQMSIPLSVLLLSWQNVIYGEQQLHSAFNKLIGK